MNLRVGKWAGTLFCAGFPVFAISETVIGTSGGSFFIGLAPFGATIKRGRF